MLVSFCCQILYFNIVSNIKVLQMNTYWTEAALLYLILHKILFRCESQIWSSGFWGTFICSSLNQHWIALHYVFWSYINLILLRHIIGDCRLIFISFYLSICNTLIKILLIYIKSIRISSLFVHININICIKLYIFAHFLVEVSFIFLWTEQKYSKHVAIKVDLFTLLRYSSVLPTF